MQAALITGTRHLELVGVPEPQPAPGAVVVDITYCGVCGTDVGAYRSGRTSHPSVFGHEWTGTIRSVGTDVADLATGDRVVIGVRSPCGACRACVAGHAGSCEAVRSMLLGYDPLASRHGGFAPAITVAAARLVPAHPALTDEEAAMIEPAAVAYRGVRRSGVGLGASVVVQGAGPIGLLTLQLALAAGATRVIAIEQDERRRAAALELGAHLALPPGTESATAVLDMTDGVGSDVVFECAGRAPLLQEAANLTRHGGVMTMLGYIEEPATIEPALWLGKDITVRASVGFAREDIVDVMALVAARRVEVAPLHSRTIGLHDLADVLDTLDSGSSADTKVLVAPR